MTRTSSAARRRNAVRIASAMLLPLVIATNASANDFYAGKRLTVLINFAAGGPTDVEGRMLARHLGRVLAGNPTVTPQNMDGAGGAVGTNWLGEVAPKDGSVLGYLTAAAWQYASDPAPKRIDFRTYEFIASHPSTSVYYMRTDVKPAMKVPTDLGRAEGIVSGGLSVDSPKDLLLRLTLDMLGHKYKYVTGYRGSNGARLALQQGEINYYSESPPSYRSVVETGIVAKGEAIGLFYDPSWDGKAFGKSKQVEGLPLPSYPELYAQIKGGTPSGELWDFYRTSLALTNELFRLIVLPPGSPKAAVEALREAIGRLNTDKEFAAESVKLFGFVPEYAAGPDTNERVRAALLVPAETKAFAAQYIKAGSAQK